MYSNIKKFFLQPSARYSLLSILVVGMLAGSAFFISTAILVDATATVDFCLSCHVMKPAYDEYQQSNHASNRSGVIATCAECHLPPDHPDKLFVKASRITEVWGYVTGVISSPEKYETQRLSMAESVWEELKANQSAPCRGCHQAEKMATEKQSEHAVKSHQRARRTNTTCIVCHQGIAHKLPVQPLPASAKPKSPGDAVYCQGCHDNFRNILAENHPTIEKGSLQKCVKCHLPGSKPADDSNNFYTFMHRSHRQRIACTGCHEVTQSGIRLLVSESRDPSAQAGRGGRE